MPRRRFLRWIPKSLSNIPESILGFKIIVHEEFCYYDNRDKKAHLTIMAKKHGEVPFEVSTTIEGSNKDNENFIKNTIEFTLNEIKTIIKKKEYVISDEIPTHVINRFRRKKGNENKIPVVNLSTRFRRYPEDVEKSS